MALVKSDYEEIIKNRPTLRHFGIYSWRAQGCLAGVRTWCDKHNSYKPIQYVFEAGTKGSGQFNDLLNSYYKNETIRKQNRIGGWSFESKNTAPLQAADVVAYEFFKSVHNHIIDKGKRPIRLSALDLFRPPQNPRLFKHFD